MNKPRKGAGHRRPKQIPFQKEDRLHRYSYGGTLRRLRRGRGARPLSSKRPTHLVFKINKTQLRHKSFRSNQGFKLVHFLIQRYAKMLFVKVEQLSIQHDHLHLVIRTSKRSFYQHFFRVVAGQIAQELTKQGLRATDTPKGSVIKESFWKYRPFTRIVIGYKAYKTLRDYVQLNEQEILGKIKYRKTRLCGLSSGEWEILWS